VLSSRETASKKQARICQKKKRPRNLKGKRGLSLPTPKLEWRKNRTGRNQGGSGVERSSYVLIQAKARKVLPDGFSSERRRGVLPKQKESRSSEFFSIGLGRGVEVGKEQEGIYKKQPLTWSFQCERSGSGPPEVWGKKARVVDKIDFIRGPCSARPKFERVTSRGGRSYVIGRKKGGGAVAKEDQTHSQARRSQRSGRAEGKRPSAQEGVSGTGNTKSNNLLRTPCQESGV